MIEKLFHEFVSLKNSIILYDLNVSFHDLFLCQQAASTLVTWVFIGMPVTPHIHL